ncbi:MAG: prepilin-type N-terminal cleavage/methylation domain-containing protein [Proteobacteria bacterium]|nr:prepilin-type N-terminal cleavage/methylation domain-containing protein [Pseudomonadota bacterium]
MRRNRKNERNSGVTLIEMVVVLAVVGVLVGGATFAFNSWSNAQRARGGARDVADLLLRARADAIRTGTNHIVFINEDHAGDPLAWAGSTWAALEIADLDGDGRVDVGEPIDGVPLMANLAFGRSDTGAGTNLADEDPFNETPLEGTLTELNSPGNFRHPTVANEINPWVLFAADGTPRAMEPNGGGANVGTVGTGDGAIYVSDGERDYVVILAPLGGIRVLSWRSGDGWR